MAELRRDLEQIVGVTHVLTDPEVAAGYVTDWTGNWHGHTAAVVRPANTDEVSRVLARCHRAGVAVVPQGGNTGLVGGSVPLHGEVVLSTARLNRIEEVDAIGCTLAAGAGVRVADAQRAAAGHGLALGVDLASRESATLGGIVATNAGGIAFVKHGNTRAQVLGLEAVLAEKGENDKLAELYAAAAPHQSDRREQLRFLQYRPVLDNRRLKEVFGYRPRKTSAEVFELYRQARMQTRQESV